MSTKGKRRDHQPIGSIPDPRDPTARVEVCVVRSHRLDEPAVIFVTKYCGREIGNQSIGLHLDTADQIATLLRDAAATCRTWQSESS
jgi:hypothetical protein